MEKAASIYHLEGFKVVITITPITNIDTPNVSIVKVDYSKIAEFVDGIMFSSYEWARTYSYPNAIHPINVIKELLNFAVSIMPPEKIFLGITTLGYDWTLPYVPGVTEATVISNNSAVQLAVENNIPIQFNEAAQSPFFNYTDIDGILLLVWFKDARSFDARAGLAEEYNLQGLSFWTIMRFNTQMWFIINAQYYIQKLLMTT